MNPHLWQLTLTGALHTARQHCDQRCFCYHATWRLLRMAGLKGTPRWHTGFYRRILAERHPWQPRRALVCGASDEIMAQTLTQLTPHLSLTVVDRCRAPLTLVNAWAHQAGIDITTTTATAPHLAGLDGPFDVIVTDGLLSLLPEPADRHALLRRLASLLSSDGLVLYSTRIAGPAGRLEYDTLGRIIQATAAATWPGSAPQRARLAHQNWRRPSRPSPFTTPQQLSATFATSFAQVQLFSHPAAPTWPLRLHPAFLTRRGSTCVGVAAASPRERP
ncbi:hypothetical protein [Streptosporangium sp. CA-115845]|uniref:hypothetical protein n=1 Tax=Streptosporangium sp. CA-115845 TaxID=3240071 RepID=UPI003D947302